MHSPSRLRLGAVLGAGPDGQSGCWFRIESSVATAIELCLFDPEERQIEMEGRGDRFELFVPGIGPGTEYGYRVHGPWDPGSGQRCNPAKLLLDPGARLMRGMIDTSPALVGHHHSDVGAPSTDDSAPHTMRSVVADSEFDWEGVDRPRTPLSESIVYETHVKGFTAAHPEVPEPLRGTYAGMAHPAAVGYLASLGVTAVELLPVQQFVHDVFLQEMGRRNYWGYNTIGFFAPHAGYAATDDPIAEFKGMVKALHRAGLEVILDVVYNHTAEGNHLGPTLSFRGLDNRAYYRLDRDRPDEYVNWSGTGNTLDFGSPTVLRLVMDSLRMWVSEFRIDGFRFDLASILGRTWGPFDPLGGFFGAIGQDPVLADVKLIAEPWDIGPGGYQVGAYPDGWSEWNDRFRNTSRDFWAGRPGSLSDFATRLTGSSDVFGRRTPVASINLVTSHDGFTLSDLVSYDHRRNEDNGEDGRDGHHDNRSWNSGAEGPTDDPDVLTIRRRRMRSMLATLLLSQGVPMLLGGDELGRTQSGNNNAYNQDGPISWFDWKNADQDLIEFVRTLTRLRREHPTFRRTAWLHEHAAPDLDHVGWFRPDGEEMTGDDWHDSSRMAVALYLRGEPLHCEEGSVSDDDVLLLANGGGSDTAFDLPAELGGTPWRVVLASSGEPESTGPGPIAVSAYGFVLLAATP